MKKFALFIISILCVLLTACSVNDEVGTYYPDITEMKANLENAGYTVTVTDESEAVYLSAVNGDDYIEFCRLKEAEAADSISDRLIEKHPNYDKFVSMENDEQFGTLVLCGTSPAVEASGIKIVQIKI